MSVIKDPSRCQSCQSRTRPLQTKSLCEKCANRIRKYRMERTKRCKALGLCFCGSPTQIGRTRCAACLAKARINSANRLLKKHDAIRLSFRLKYKENPDYFNSKRRKYTVKIRAEVLEAYGNKCVCCGETTNEFLQIDHKNNDGASHRRSLKSPSIYGWLRKQGYPKDNYQLMCANCNWAKGRYGYCPHTKNLNSVSIAQ